MNSGWGSAALTSVFANEDWPGTEVGPSHPVKPRGVARQSSRAQGAPMNRSELADVPIANSSRLEAPSMRESLVRIFV